MEERAHSAGPSFRIGPFDTVGVFSPGLARLRHLKDFVECERVVWCPTRRAASRLDAVIGWGHKPTARRARDYAERCGVPYVALEDGFLRSVGIGRGEPPLSIVVDPVGVYYDARGPSWLEGLLANTSGSDPLKDATLIERARHCRERIIRARVSKYNHTPVGLPAWLRAQASPFVLVVDQTLDDASVNLGLGGADSFERMLEAAQREHPNARIIVKTHPAAVAGLKRGYLAGRDLPRGVELVDTDVNPLALLEHARHVYVCSSQLGFEALLLGKSVSCFGAPFYAGWGLTDDRVEVSRRNARRSVDELVAAALLLYPRYVHPITGRRCPAEDVIEHLALQREVYAENDRHYLCIGFSPWKRPFLRRYLGTPGGEVQFARTVADRRRPDAPPPTTVVTWGSKDDGATEHWASKHYLDCWRMEDGFLRSVRLGSDLAAPGSLVVDRQGIYFDPSRPSELETLLETAEFTQQERRRAASLRQAIVRSRVSKYNPPSRSTAISQIPTDRRVLLVVGQVEDDASVRLGSPAVRTNEELLRRVRAANPDAFILYRPHPDVVARNRRGRVVPNGPRHWDVLATDLPLDQCFERVDEVHTMTSLVGFEALLRQRGVVTYGQPFYAGWGLTRDLYPVARRTRRLSVDELVAGCLIRYPRYYSWRAKAFCTPEDMVFELERERARYARVSRLLPGAARRVHGWALSGLEWARAF